MTPITPLVATILGADSSMVKYDRLLSSFEQGFQLSVYKALLDGTAVGDRAYIERVTRENERVCAEFLEEGETGVRFLVYVLGQGSIDERERAACILGRIGKDYQGQPDIAEVLAERRRAEKENCVAMRIDFSLEQLVAAKAKASPSAR